MVDKPYSTSTVKSHDEILKQHTPDLYNDDSTYFDIKSETIDNNSSDTDTESEPIYPPFDKLRPQKVEFTSMSPQYPKSHPKGYATVIALPETILTPMACDQLKNSLQYSMSNAGGGGIRIKEHIEFFAKKDDFHNIPMAYSCRQCAGVKVCV